MLLLCLPAVLTVLSSSSFSSIAVTNGVLQLLVFVLTAHLPCLFTGRMSYVDIAWPWGLITIGLIPLLSSAPNSGDLRTWLVSFAYLIAGGRMALGGAVALTKGRFETEFPR